MKPASSKARACHVTITLKNPTRTYRPRFVRLIKNMLALRNIKPYGQHLWQVMDGVPFQDTETAVEIALKQAQTSERTS